MAQSSELTCSSVFAEFSRFLARKKLDAAMWWLCSWKIARGNPISIKIGLYERPTLSNLIYMLHINQYAVSEYVILIYHGPVILVAHVTDNCTRKRPASIRPPYFLLLEEYMKIKPPYLLSLEEYMKIKQHSVQFARQISIGRSLNYFFICIL